MLSTDHKLSSLPGGRFLLGILGSVLCLGLAPLSASAERIYSDAFTLGEKESPGSGLDKRHLENGDVQWIAATNAEPVLTKNGTVSVKDSKSSAQAIIPIEPFTSEIKVRARVRPFTSDWIGLGLLSDKDQTKWFDEANQAWVYLKPSGKAHLMLRGTKSVSHRRPPPDFDSSGFHLLEIIYDARSNTVTASIDDIPLSTPLELGLFVPKISAIGFRIHRDPNAMLVAGAPQVDVFEVIAQ